MKKIFLLFFLISTSLVSFSQGNNYLTLSDSAFNVSSAGSTANVFWLKSNVAWTATCSQPWIRLYKNQGTGDDSLSVYVAENTTTSARQGTVIFKSADSSLIRSIYITQAAGAKSLSISSTQLQLTGSTQSQIISISSNTNWITSSNNSWITLNKSNGTGNDSITITVTKNTGSQTRTGSIKAMLSDNSNVNAVTIIQMPDTTQLLSTNDALLNLGANTGSKYLHISSNSSWNVTNNNSWVQVNKTSGINNDSILISIPQNPTNSVRTATLTVSSQDGKIVKPITINQAGSSTYLLVYDSIENFPAVPTYSTRMVSVQSNANWTASSSQPWVKLDETKGVGTDSLGFSVTNNTTNAIRTAIITIRTTDSLVTRYINITQAAGSSSTLTVSQTNIQANANGETEKVGIGSNSGWVVYPSSSWISINKSTGTGNDSLAITVAKNTGSQSRTGSVKVILQDSSIIKTITIKQSAPTVAVATDTLFFVANSIVNQHVAINTTNPYYFYNGQNSWLTITKNADTLSIAAATNTSSSSRTSTINIYSSDSLLIHIIKVVQYGVTIEKAKSVSISAGTLSSALTSNEAKAVTELTISGTMDVRDFLFIRDSMTSLTKLNLNAVSIALYQGTIDSSLFKSAVTVSFPANTIPANALKGKTTLTEIVLPATLGAIESNAFSGCTNLKSVTLSSNPTVSSTAFDNVDKSTCAIVVPSSLVSSYESSSVWSQFSTIKEESTTEIITTTTATDFSIYPNPTKGEVFINGISTNAVIAVYGVNGLFISSEVVKGNKTGLFTNLPQGIYIIKLKDGKQEIARRLIKE